MTDNKQRTARTMAAVLEFRRMAYNDTTLWDKQLAPVIAAAIADQDAYAAAVVSLLMELTKGDISGNGRCLPRSCGCRYHVAATEFLARYQEVPDEQRR